MRVWVQNSSEICIYIIISFATVRNYKERCPFREFPFIFQLYMPSIWINSPPKKMRFFPELFHPTRLLATQCAKYFSSRTIEKKNRSFFFASFVLTKVNKPSFWVNSPPKKMRFFPELFHATRLLATQCAKYFSSRTIEKKDANSLRPVHIAYFRTNKRCTNWFSQSLG